MINATIHVTPRRPVVVPPRKKIAAWPAWSIGFLVLATLAIPPGGLYGMDFLLVIFATIYWAASGEKSDSNLLRGIVPFVFIIVIGLISGFGANTYLYLKDAWYASAFIVYLTTGYVLYRCQPSLAIGLRAFVVAGTIAALFKLSTFALHPELLQLSAAEVREQVGYGSPAPQLAIAILFAYFRRWRVGLKLPTWFAATCLFICLIAVAASFSRQALVTTTVCCLAAAGFFARREILRLGVVAVIGVMALLVLRSSLDIDVNTVQSNFLGKLARAPEELLIKDYSVRSSIQANWRGYETSQAFRTYVSGTPFEMFLGQGFGHSLDLGLFINLGGAVPGVRERINSAPILHNGYAFLLMKTGPLAVVLLAYAIAWLYRIGRRHANSDQGLLAAPSRVLQALSVIFVMITWVSMGALAGGIYVLAAGYLLAALTRGVEPELVPATSANRAPA